MKFSDDFTIAVQDYFNLLNKKYPQKAILELVGTRYKLSREERSMLYRGVSSSKENKVRAQKMINENLKRNQLLHIDGFNQLLTIASYLNGNMVFISTDGYMRDASEIHCKIFRSDLLERAIKLIINYLNTLEVKAIMFYIDHQLRSHTKVKDSILKESAEIEVVLSDEVDKKLKNTSKGIIATSDSQIIEKSNQKIFDLAHHVLKYHFNPKITDLKTLLLQ